MQNWFVCCCLQRDCGIWSRFYQTSSSFSFIVDNILFLPQMLCVVFDYFHFSLTWLLNKMKKKEKTVIPFFSLYHNIVASSVITYWMREQKKNMSSSNEMNSISWSLFRANALSLFLSKLQIELKCYRVCFRLLLVECVAHTNAAADNVSCSNVPVAGQLCSVQC